MFNVRLWYISKLIDWLIDDWLIDWVSDWLIDWLIDWLTDWLIDWLTDWLIDWLIDWRLAFDGGVFRFLWFCSMDVTAETGRYRRLLNHSRRAPNLRTDSVAIHGAPSMILQAKRNINAGEELVWDYEARCFVSLVDELLMDRGWTFLMDLRGVFFTHVVILYPTFSSRFTTFGQCRMTRSVVKSERTIIGQIKQL